MLLVHTLEKLKEKELLLKSEINNLSHFDTESDEAEFLECELGKVHRKIATVKKEISLVHGRGFLKSIGIQ